MRIAEKIVRVMETPLTLEDGRVAHHRVDRRELYPTISATAERLLKRRRGHVQRQGMGRNNFQTYVAVPEESHQQRIALEAKLRVAERNNELRVYYQPRVDARTKGHCRHGR